MYIHKDFSVYIFFTSIPGTSIPVKQIWFADDSTAGGKLDGIRMVDKTEGSRINIWILPQAQQNIPDSQTSQQPNKSRNNIQ